MLWSSLQGRSLAASLAVAACVVATPAAAQDPNLCIDGPLVPDNPNNRLTLCSPAGSGLLVEVLPDAVQLSWDAPPRNTSTAVSPVLAGQWEGLPDSTVVPGVVVDGTYLAFRDHRIQIDILAVDSLGAGAPVADGVIGRDRVRVGWSSIHESTPTRSTGGTFDVLPSYSGQGMRFDFPNPTPGFPPDTTVLAGLRLRLSPGQPVRAGDFAVFDVEDFEGWHIWRWSGDPSSPSYQSLGEYSKLAGTPDGAAAWPGVVPSSRRLVYQDTDVFDGFVYHYAVTTYDQGFRRAARGDLGRKYESPLELATLGTDGQYILGPTQVRLEYRRLPPADFQPIAAVPNPFREAAIVPGQPETAKVSFVNAPPKGTLYVFTLAGDLVFQRNHDLPTIGTIDWNTRNQNNQPVASGVYIYKIVDLVSGEQSYGRLAIIR